MNRILSFFDSPLRLPAWTAFIPWAWTKTETFNPFSPPRSCPFLNIEYLLFFSEGRRSGFFLKSFKIQQVQIGKFPSTLVPPRLQTTYMYRLTSLGYFRRESSSSLLHPNHAGFRRNIMIHSVATSFLGSSDRWPKSYMIKMTCIMQKVFISFKHLFSGMFTN